MNRRTLIAALLAAVSAIAVGAFAASAVQAPSLAWKARGNGLRCADLVVPVDWARPAGPRCL